MGSQGHWRSHTAVVAESQELAMAVGLSGLPELTPVPGMRIGSARAAIKSWQRDDVALFELSPETATAAVFTRNAFCAAPVTIARAHLATCAPRFLLVNAGNANAGTGRFGLEAARATCKATAEQGECLPEEVLPFSTGVIGAAFPDQKVIRALPEAFQSLQADAWERAACAIMTTDTFPKGASRQVEIEGRLVTITGVAKGAGMIRPDMATMLAFIATDVALPQPLLQASLVAAVAESFNHITVDGDTSTNDACVLMATGYTQVVIADHHARSWQSFNQALMEVCQQLAQAIVRDGEGATRFITIRVEQANSRREAEQVAYTIAHSPLVKTAFFAGDPNWGRILAAVGRAGVQDLSLSGVDIYLSEVCIVRGGEPAQEYREEYGQQVMARDEIMVRVRLRRGSMSTTIWTCDLSYDYVRINAEYRT